MDDNDKMIYIKKIMNCDGKTSKLLLLAYLIEDITIEYDKNNNNK